MKKFFTVILLSVVCIAAFAQTPKYVFYMIGDGMGIGHAYITDRYNVSLGQPEVNFYHFPVRCFVNTYSANSYVTDSAAGGSALATGCKVNNTSIAMSVDGQPLESLADRAKKSGYATGVVSSGAITDATPAVFYAKAETRYMSTSISRQLIDSKVDFAGGEYFQTEKGSDLKTDYWVEEARKAGIEVFKGKAEYKRTSSRVLMLPASGNIPYAIDRQEGDDELADLTEAAIDHLYNKSRKGFFLMVEGAKIDHVAHSNDAGAIVREVNDFCKSIDLVLNFCAKHPGECLVVVIADHETGGMGLVMSKTYQGLGTLENQTCSVNTLTSRLADLQKNYEFVPWPVVRETISDATGLWTKIPVDLEETRLLAQLYKECYIDGDVENVKNLYTENRKIAVEAIKYLDEKAGCKFATSSHSSYPLGLYVYGAKASQFSSCVENIDVPATIAKVAKYK